MNVDLNLEENELVSTSVLSNCAPVIPKLGMFLLLSTPNPVSFEAPKGTCDKG